MASRRQSPFIDDIPEFFRVFLPYTSSHKMSIPEAFIKNFKGVIPEKVILLDHLMKPWHVNMEQTDERLFFSNGWQDFVRDHLLEFGDLLTFGYDGNSSFEVKIFNKDGCMKKIADDKTISLGRDSKVKKACNNPAYGDKQEHSIIDFKKNEVASCSSKGDQWKSQVLEKNKMLKDSHFLESKNPYFTLAISSYSKYFVHIPRSILHPLNVKMMPDVVIHNQNGNIWPVKINFLNSGRIYFGRGWRVFIRQNNIEIGDQCVFEFVIGGENICNEVHVQILRGNARVMNPFQHRFLHKA